MTRKEAMEEARKRWGARGQAWKHPVDGECYVMRGVPRGNAAPVETMGCGPTWEAAFADADNRSSAT